MVICLERGADLHIAQLMPLPLTVSCFSKLQIGFTFLVPAQLGSPGKRAVKRVCVWVCAMHKAHKHQQPLYMCFVDFKKAFDSISHDKLWVTMMDMGYPLHLIDLLARLYRKQLAKVKVAGTLSERFRVKKGVRQGCVRSPYLRYEMQF